MHHCNISAKVSGGWPEAASAAAEAALLLCKVCSFIAGLFEEAASAPAAALAEPSPEPMRTRTTAALLTPDSGGGSAFEGAPLAKAALLFPSALR